MSRWCLSIAATAATALLAACPAATPPPDQPVLPGNPPYLWNCGWMAIANADGVLEERRVVRSGMTWIPRNANLATSFQWALTPGTVVTAIEIRPEAV